MCGRYVSPGEADLEREFSLLRRWESLVPSYNVAPTQPVPAVREERGTRVGVQLRWGLVPFFAHGVPPHYATINARVETLETAAAYRGPWRRGQRCIQIASGFYEWHLDGTGRKVPYYVHLVDREVFGFAALWDRSVAADGALLESCAQITVAANPLLHEIHNSGAHPHRMPAILRREDYGAWLGGTAAAARDALVPYPAELMVAYRVSTRVNSARNNDARLLEPVVA